MFASISAFLSEVVLSPFVYCVCSAHVVSPNWFNFLICWCFKHVFFIWSCGGFNCFGHHIKWNQFTCRKCNMQTDLILGKQHFWQWSRFMRVLTCLFFPPAFEVWFSEPCHPSWSLPAFPPGTAPLQWVHLAVCDRSESDQLVTPSLSSNISIEKTVQPA